MRKRSVDSGEATDAASRRVGREVTAHRLQLVPDEAAADVHEQVATVEVRAELRPLLAQP